MIPSAFFAHNHIKPSLHKAFSLNYDLIGFARAAKTRLQAAIPGSFVASPYTRVDIFRTQLGKLVVNEFESLEAMTEATKQADANGPQLANDIIDGSLNKFKVEYWTDKLVQLLNELLERV
jgi:hypothetical protein